MDHFFDWYLTMYKANILQLRWITFLIGILPCINHAKSASALLEYNYVEHNYIELPKFNFSIILLMNMSTHRIDETKTQIEFVAFL